MALFIHKAHIDQLTSHVTVQAQLRETVNGQTTFGPLETLGIDYDSLMGLHGAGPVTEDSLNAAMQRWLEQHHDRMLARKRAHDCSAQAVAKLKGVALEFGGGA